MMTIGMLAKACADLIAVEAARGLTDLVHEALEATGLPELAGAGTAASTANWGVQHGVDAGIRDLLRTNCRSRTSRSSVAPLPWKNTTITPGLRTSNVSGTCTSTRLSL